MIQDPCPACAHAEARALFSATDRLYRTTSRLFNIVECARCGLIRLHPRPPNSELAEYYPPGYWFVPENTAADRLEQVYRRFVLHDRLNFNIGIDALNLTNHVQFGAPTLSPTATNFGAVTTQANGARQLQMNARIEF